MTITKNERATLGGFLIALFGLSYFLFKPFLLTVMLSLTVVVMTYPVYDFLLSLKLLRGRRGLAAALMTLFLLFLIILPVTFLASILVDRIYAWVQHVDFREAFQSVLASEFYVGVVEPYVHRMETELATKINVLDYLTQFIKARAVGLYQFSPKVVLGTASYVFDFIVLLVTIYFLYVEGPSLLRLLIELSPLRDSDDKQLIGQFKQTIRATIYGTVVTAFLQAVLSLIGFYICGLKIALILGVVAFFTSMIPFVGAAGVWVPATVWLFLQGETGYGTFLLLYGIFVVSSIDNFVKPMLMRGKTKIHPLLIFFSLIGGLSLMGPIGLFYGPVILASLVATIALYRRELTKHGDYAYDGR